MTAKGNHQAPTKAHPGAGRSPRAGSSGEAGAAPKKAGRSERKPRSDGTGSRRTGGAPGTVGPPTPKAGESSGRSRDRATVPRRPRVSGRRAGQAMAERTPIPPPTDLKALADEINMQHGYFTGSLRTTVRFAFAVGRCLIRVKNAVDHGKFTPWIEENCHFSPSTARAYMRLARDRAILTPANDPNQQSSDDLTIDKALRRLTKSRRKRSDAGTGAAQAPGSVAIMGDAVTGQAAREPARPEGDAAPEDGRSVVEAGPEQAQAGRDDGPDRRRDTSRAAPSRSPGPGAGAAPRPAEVTEEVPDARAWLESLSIRARLADPAIFDSDALIWHRLGPIIEALLREYQPTDEDFRCAGVSTWIRQRYTYRIAFLTGVMSPEEWALCQKCQGTGASSALRKECDWCRGAGYEVTHRADDRGIGEEACTEAE